MEHNLEIITHNLRKKYISDDIELTNLIKETSRQHQVILLVAPQGTGKSYYFQNMEEERIIIAPTRALTNQYHQMSIKNRYGDTSYVSDTYIRSHMAIADNIDSVEYLIIDEIHKAVQYSDFAYQQTDTIMKSFDEFYKSGKPIILTTATPELLYCLKGYPIFDQIKAEIKIETNKEFVEQVRIMDDYTEQKMKDLVCESYDNDHDSMQIVLVNNKKSVAKLDDYFNDLGIKAIGITSETRKSEVEAQRVFKELTDNRAIDYSVLIATAWVDVGINFNNENITDLYCMFDNEYSRGDFTLLWQFMARARNCKPRFYITKPVLSDREKHLIEYGASLLKIDSKEYELTLKGEFDTDYPTKEYSVLFNSLCDSAKDAIEEFENGLIGKDVIDHIPGIYFGSGDDFAKFSEIPIKYFLHGMIEKLNFNNDMITDHTNCDVIKNCTNASDDFVQCTNAEIGNVKHYLFNLIFKQVEFTQDEVKENLNRITNNKLGISQLKSFIKDSGFNMKLINHRRTRKDRLNRLFFDFNFSEVRRYCDGYDLSFSQIGYAKYSKDEMETIKELKPDIEIFKDLNNSNEEYFVNISCIDVGCEDKMLVEALYLIE